MTTVNYTPGQILYIKPKSSFTYISILTGTSPHHEGTMIHTCCDLIIHEYSKNICEGEILFAREMGSMLDVDTSFEEIKLAKDSEKKILFNALVCSFKEYDSKWANHFTDSLHFEILDWLAWEFDVDLDDEANQNTSLGETISEIQNYIWDTLCKETNNYQVCTDHVEPEMVNKQELIDKVRNWLEKHTYDDEYWLSEGNNLCLDSLIDDMCKYLEK